MGTSGHQPHEVDAAGVARVAHAGQATPEDIARAAALAEEMRTQDVARRAAADAAHEVASEVGIPAVYLEQAAALIKADNERKQRRIRNARSLAAGAVCLIVTAIALNYALRPLNTRDEDLARAYRTGAQRELTTNGTMPLSSSSGPIPEGQLVPLTILPVEPSAPITAAASPLFDYPTTLTFTNQSGGTVKIWQMTAMSSPKFQVQLRPGGRARFATTFGVPWLVTNEAGGSIGLFFPTGNPGAALIPDGRFLDALAAATPASRPDYYGSSFLTPVPPSTAHSKASSTLLTAVQFVNMCSSPIDLYRGGPAGTRSLIKTVPPGADYTSKSYVNDLWFALDADGNVLAAFKAAPVPKPAIIWPADP